MNRFTRHCDRCGKTFITHNIEQFVCWKCRKRGLTYKELKTSKFIEKKNKFGKKDKRY